MHKGDPVLVKGKFQTRTYEDKDGNPKTETRITADTVGHDLSRGIANYMRNRSRQPAQDGGPAEGQAAEGQAAEWPWTRNFSRGPDELIDEGCHRAVRPGLGRTSDLAARALAEDQDDEDDEDGRHRRRRGAPGGPRPSSHADPAQPPRPGLAAGPVSRSVRCRTYRMRSKA